MPVLLTPEQKKTSACMKVITTAVAHHYRRKETLRCTLSGEIPTWENVNEGNIVSVEGK
nr:hypothetical protein [Klebsiella variicola]